MKDTQLFFNTDTHQGSRTISLFGIIDTPAVQEAIIAIQEINGEDDLNLQAFKANYPLATPEPRKPIIVDIQSPGGNISDGFSLIATIEQSKAPVHTRVNGYAYSMAMVIFLAGEQRYISRFADLMYHQLSAGSEGTLKDLSEDLVVSRKVQKKVEEYVIERTNLTLRDLQNIYKKKQDRYYSPTESLSLNLATKII